MTQDQTPSLRFPEFQGKDPWEEILIGQILSESKVPSRDNDPQKRITVKLTLQGIVHRNFKGTESKNATKHFVREAGQFIYGKQNIHKGAFGIIPNHLDGFETSQDLPAFDFTGLCHPSWFLYYIERENFYTSLEIKMSGTGSKRLKPEVFCGLTIAIPPLSEQQKITECLSSLDEVITAQGDRLNGLKDYKRGLMQQLFPADGQTTPTLRFPEFQGKAPWEVKPLGEICDYWNGASHERSITENGTHYLISLNSIDIEGNLKSSMKRLPYTDKSLQKNDLVMVLSDVAHGNFLGLTDVIPNNQFVLNQRMAGLRLKDTDIGNTVFLRTFINYNQNYFKRKGQGSSQLNLSKPAVTEFPILLPNIEEQQRIADCLSLLDDLITVQKQKIKTLKHHKNGLMQQLFPKL